MVMMKNSLATSGSVRGIVRSRFLIRDFLFRISDIVVLEYRYLRIIRIVAVPCWHSLSLDASFSVISALPHRSWNIVNLWLKLSMFVSGNNHAVVIIFVTVRSSGAGRVVGVCRKLSTAF